MKKSITKEFGAHKPRALVLDDNARAREMTARRLRRQGFETIECTTVEDFEAAWKPGTIDVIVADWELSHDVTKHGDKVLELVRTRDWDVPFVLISGKLHEAEERAEILQALLKGGGARFVERGDDGIQEACKSAEELIERRDLALLQTILSLREGALDGSTLRTSSGEQSVAELLESIVANPQESHETERPLAKAKSKKRAAARR